jgi:myo-inositol 2-dehydrogenase/D-chiro-inositol 1-dehydrogenase
MGFDGIEVSIYDVADGVAQALATAVGASVAAYPDQIFAESDAIVIATTTDTHADLLIQAARAGKPVFCEKPISHDLAATKEALDVVEESRIPAQIGFNRRFDPEFREVRDMVQHGDVGEIYLVTSMTHDPEPPSRAYLEASGGFYKDTLSHDFDAVRFVTGQEIVEVTATGATLVSEMFRELGDPDVTVVSLRLSEGTLGMITAARHDPIGYDVRMQVFGSKDSVGVGFGPAMPLRRPAGGPDASVEPYSGFQDRFAEAYRSELEAFLDVARGKAESACTVRDAYQVLRAASACELSVKEGRPVRLDEVA